MFNRDAGFTLLETLAVMVIVGLLAAITVPQISKWREGAHITSVKSDLKNAANAMEADHDGNAYPSAIPSYFKATSGNTVALSTGTGGAAKYHAPAGTPAFGSMNDFGGFTVSNIKMTSLNTLVVDTSCHHTRVSATLASCIGNDGSRHPTFTVYAACAAAGSAKYTYVEISSSWSMDMTVSASWQEQVNNGRESDDNIGITNDSMCPPSTSLKGARFVDETGLDAAVGVLAIPAPIDGTFCLNGASTKTTKKFSYSSVEGLKSGACV